MNATAILTLISGVAFFCACQGRNPADDPGKLKDVLLSYFDGITNKDFKKMTEATTDDFVLYEMGRVWNNDSVFIEMKKSPIP